LKPGAPALKRPTGVQPTFGRTVRKGLE
jgi:hypothetical protein